MDKCLKQKYYSGANGTLVQVQANDTNKSKKVNWPYTNEYLDVCFTHIVENLCQIPLCVICGEKPCNSTYKIKKTIYI